MDGKPVAYDLLLTPGRAKPVKRCCVGEQVALLGADQPSDDGMKSVTNSKGRFVFETVEPGRYRLATQLLIAGSPIPGFPDETGCRARGYSLGPIEEVTNVVRSYVSVQSLEAFEIEAGDQTRMNIKIKCEPRSDEPVNGPVFGPTVSAIDHPKLGKILVTGNGFTLYRSTVEDVSARIGVFRPVTVESEHDVAVGHGVDRSRVGVVTQPDGTFAITHYGELLYTFDAPSGIGDELPGYTEGHGFNGEWFAVTPKGKLVR